MNRFAIKYHTELPNGNERREHKSISEAVSHAKGLAPTKYWVRIEIPVMMNGPPQYWGAREAGEQFDPLDENVEQIIDDSMKFATELVDRAMEVYNTKKRTREEILAFIAGGELDEEKKIKI